MKLLPYILAFTLSSHLAFAHDAPVVAADKLVPIPAYTQSDKVASGNAARKAVQALINSLSEAQRNVLLLPYNAESKKTGWNNLPAGIVPRPGLRLGDLDAHQRAHLFAFLSASLSPQGYERVADIMAGEAFLSGDPMAERLKWAPENYWLAIFGTPSDNAPWAWQFGGHHLGLNLSVNNDAINSMSPSFVGTEPAVFTYDGIEYNNIRDMHLAGYAIYKSLNEKQKIAATLLSVPADVVTGPGKDNVALPQVGVLAANFNEAQRTLLLNAIKLWVSIQPNENADARMQQIAKELDQTSFGWVGSAKNNEEAYFRIQGPTLLIELVSNGNNVGQTAKGKGHYHTIYRNPTFEYGKAPRRP